MTKPDKIFIDISRKGTDWWIRPADQDDVAHGYEWDTEYTRSDLVPGWVSVDERLPEENDNEQIYWVIVRGNLCTCTFEGGEFLDTDDYEPHHGVRYWMRQPPLPREGK